MPSVRRPAGAPAARRPECSGRGAAPGDSVRRQAGAPGACPRPGRLPSAARKPPRGARKGAAARPNGWHVPGTCQDVPGGKIRFQAMGGWVRPPVRVAPWLVARTSRWESAPSLAGEETLLAAF